MKRSGWVERDIVEPDPRMRQGCETENVGEASGVQTWSQTNGQQEIVDKLMQFPCRTLLNLLAWLAPDPIPLTLIRAEPKEPANIPIANREKALKDLADYSLAKWSTDGSSVTVHRLVQDVTRTRLTEPMRAETLKDSLWMMDEFAVGNLEDVHTWKAVYDPIRDHASVLIAQADKAGISEPTARLMNEMAAYFCGHALHAKAEPLFRRALSIDEQSYGPDHPEVATVLNNLAGLLHDTNRHAEAESLVRRALAIMEGSLGLDHPHVATVLNSLARLLHDTNRHTEAEPLFRRALHIDEQSGGPNALNVTRDLNNLAGLLQAIDRYAEAESMLRQSPYSAEW